MATCFINNQALYFGITVYMLNKQANFCYSKTKRVGDIVIEVKSCTDLNCGFGGAKTQ